MEKVKKVKLSANMKEVVDRMRDGLRLFQASGQKYYYCMPPKYYSTTTINGLIKRGIVKRIDQSEGTVEITLTDLGKSISL